MKKKGKLLTLALLCAGIVGIAVVGYAQKEIRVTTGEEIIILPFTCKLKVIEYPDRPGPVDMKFTVAPAELCRNCEEIALTVTTKNGLVYAGPTNWTVKADKDNPYSTTFRVNVPPNDTSFIRIWMESGGFSQKRTTWFTTTSESIKVWYGRPQKTCSNSQPDSSITDKKRARMTPEQLQKEHHIRVDFRTSSPWEIDLAKNLLGPLTPTDQDSVYTVRTTYENILKLRDWSIWYKYLKNELHWQSTPADSASSKKSKPDSLEPQGALDADPGISVDYVHGEFTPGVLSMNDTIRFHFCLHNNSGQSIQGITNGFRLYSPDHLTH